MIYFHQILPHLLYPLTFVFALLIWGLRIKSKFPIFLALIILTVTSSPIISGYLNSLLESGQLRRGLHEIKNADAIVILSGMIRPVASKDGLIYEWNDPDRFFAGLELINANKANIIIFTGAKLPWEKGGKSEGDVLAQYARKLGVMENKIYVTKQVQNTKDEAAAVKSLLDQLNLNTIILVTSAFHMTRAEGIFGQVGIDLQPYPVDSRIGASEFTFMELIPSASALAGFDFFIRELIGRTYYKLKSF